jgi:hypothetical protein
MIWVLPRGVSFILPICFLWFEIWTASILATYFAPKAQMSLNHTYSKQLLEDLVRNDDLKRV